MADDLYKVVHTLPPSASLRNDHDAGGYVLSIVRPVTRSAVMANTPTR